MSAGQCAHTYLQCQLLEPCCSACHWLPGHASALTQQLLNQLPSLGAQADIAKLHADLQAF